MNLQSHATGIGALAEGTRLALYEYVVGESEPVGREQAARALGLPLRNVSFHLDRLVEEGLLDVEYRRLSGRTGPGAGRPNKLYKRSDREFAVTIPPRRYEQVGAILADAFERTADGVSVSDAISISAREAGLAAGRAASVPDGGDCLDRLAVVLDQQGYEPHDEDGALVLLNCPYHALVEQHTELVCGLNQNYVQGVADGLGCVGVDACSAPREKGCCVKAQLAEPAETSNGG